MLLCTKHTPLNKDAMPGGHESSYFILMIGPYKYRLYHKFSMWTNSKHGYSAALDLLCYLMSYVMCYLIFKTVMLNFTATYRETGFLKKIGVQYLDKRAIINKLSRMKEKFSGVYYHRCR